MQESLYDHENFCRKKSFEHSDFDCHHEIHEIISSSSRRLPCIEDFLSYIIIFYYRIIHPF